MYLLFFLISLIILITYFTKKHFIDIKVIYYYLKIKYFESKSIIPDSELINDKVIKINYRYDNNMYSVYLPISKIRFNTKKYYLIKNKDEKIFDIDEKREDPPDDIISDESVEIDISQQKGIQYYVNATELEGDYIIVKQFDNIIYKYNGDIIPSILNK